MLLALLTIAGGALELSRPQTAALGHPVTPTAGSPSKRSGQARQPPVPGASGSSGAGAQSDLPAVGNRVASGVVSITTLACPHGTLGTGIVLSDDMVATAYHLVARSAVVSLGDAGRYSTGTVIGADPQHDLAVIRTGRPLAGHHFALSAHGPSAGESVAAVGFPLGKQRTVTSGSVRALDGEGRVDGITIRDLIETDTHFDPGLSGGPLIAADGSVVGLIDSSSGSDAIDGSITAGVLAADATRWARHPVAPAATGCGAPLGPTPAQPRVAVAGSAAAPTVDSHRIAGALTTYFEGIDSGDYPTAYQILAPDQQAGTSEQSLADGDASSYDFEIVIAHIRPRDTNTAVVDVTFTSIQPADKGPDGATCDLWSLAYTMIDIDDSWRIDSVAAYGESTHTPCDG